MRHILFLVLLCTCLFVRAQDSPKYEVRGAWISTITNIDWPSSKRLSSEEQQRELVAMIDSLAHIGINTLFFQVRPMCDAFYRSSKEPWSEWLCGKQGQAPDPFYDPLELAIKTAHANCMELHAWVNPFRAVTTPNRNISAEHVTVKHPEWVVSFSESKYLNPGLVEVRKYVTEIIAEIAANYDVDGVHFDDYFYPYPQQGIPFRDKQTYSKNNPDSLGLKDWRRENINILIEQVRDTLRMIKPRLKFGISPFGIWRNSMNDDLGSETRGLTSYDDVFADTRKWVQNGWVDYVVPQLYWRKNHRVADFNVLLYWWTNNSFGRHLYIGHAAYKTTAHEHQAWQSGNEIPKQVRMVRQQPNALGSSFFSATTLFQNQGGLADTLAMNYYARPALQPRMPWIDSIAPLPPRFLQVEAQEGQTVLQWGSSGIATDGNKAHQYVIYKFTDLYAPFTASNRNILAVVRGNQNQYIDKVPSSKSLYYAVSAVDAFSNESQLVSNITLYPSSYVVSATIYDSTALVKRYVHVPLKANVFTRIVLNGLSDQVDKESILVNGDRRIETFEIEFELDSNKTTLLSFMVKPTEEDDYTLSVQYSVAGAGWEPIYTVRTHQGQDSVRIDQKAYVFQNTGVSWENTSLQLASYQSQGKVKLRSAKPVNLASSNTPQLLFMRTEYRACKKIYKLDADGAHNAKVFALVSNRNLKSGPIRSFYNEEYFGKNQLNLSADSDSVEIYLGLDETVTQRKIIAAPQYRSVVMAKLFSRKETCTININNTTDTLAHVVLVEPYLQGRKKFKPFVSSRPSYVKGNSMYWDFSLPSQSHKQLEFKIKRKWFAAKSAKVVVKD